MSILWHSQQKIPSSEFFHCWSSNRDSIRQHACECRAIAAPQHRNRQLPFAWSMHARSPAAHIFAPKLSLSLARARERRRPPPSSPTGETGKTGRRARASVGGDQYARHHDYAALGQQAGSVVVAVTRAGGGTPTRRPPGVPAPIAATTPWAQTPPRALPRMVARRGPAAGDRSCFALRSPPLRLLSAFKLATAGLLRLNPRDPASARRAKFARLVR